MLFSSPNPTNDKIINEILCQPEIEPMSPTQENMMLIRNCLKIGNFKKLKRLINSLAAYSAGLSEFKNVKNQKVDFPRYRQELKRILLDERDWSDKTLLHIAIDAKSKLKFLISTFRH